MLCQAFLFSFLSFFLFFSFFLFSFFFFLVDSGTWEAEEEQREA
jgi:hypothetical protein